MRLSQNLNRLGSIETLKREKEASLEGWRYRISKERFLNRFPAQKEVMDLVYKNLSEQIAGGKGSDS